MNSKSIFTWLISGIIGGILFCLFFYTIDNLYQNPFLPDSKSLDFFIYLLVMIASLAVYRFIISQNRTLRFWEGLIIGFFTGSLMILISIPFMYILLSSPNNSSVQNYIEYEIQNFKDQKEGFIEKQKEYGRDGNDLFEKSLAEMKEVKKEDVLSFLLQKEFWQKIILVVFVSIVAAAVLRN